jgi:hypothetical protein
MLLSGNLDFVERRLRDVVQTLLRKWFVRFISRGVVVN